MSKELYVPKRFGRDALAIIDEANTIITEYQAQGFTLTLRQLHYQFVARDLYANTQRNYKRLGSIINDARLAGLVDWLAIEDRQRNLEKLPTWESPRDIIEACASQYRTDKWADQPNRVEVWIEKDALSGVIERVCHDYNLPHLACRGYASASAVWLAGRRIKQYARAGQHVIVLHLGDHDPSGLDMTRDNDARLDLLSRSGPVEVRRLALNMDQVVQYNPPENFAKTSDSRSPEYIKRYGNKSWELDALDPTVIDGLIRTEVESILDDAAWETSTKKEDGQRAKLQAVADSWTD